MKNGTNFSEVQLSLELDGKRLYVTTSLFSPWGKLLLLGLLSLSQRKQLTSPVRSISLKPPLMASITRLVCFRLADKQFNPDWPRC